MAAFSPSFGVAYFRWTRVAGVSMTRSVAAAVVATLLSLGGVAFTAGPRARHLAPQPLWTAAMLHEPTGYLPALRFGFSSSPGDIWKLSARAGVTQNHASDPGALVSAPHVLQVSFPANWKDDSSLPLLSYWQVFGGGSGGLYLAFAFKLSSGWRGLSSGVDNVLTLYPSSDYLKAVSIVMLEAKAAGITPKLRLRGLAHRYANSKNPWLEPNLATDPTVSTDQWHRLELLFQPNSSGQKDGAIQWWLDGDPMGAYEDIGFWDVDDGRIWAAEWRVAGPNKKGLSSPQTMWLDDAYLSLAAGGDRVILRNDARSGYAAESGAETMAAIDGWGNDDTGIPRCLNDALRWSDLTFVNLLHGGGCPPWAPTTPFADEVVVFSVDDPVTLHQGSSPGSIWTATAGDWPSIELGGKPVEVPLVVWLASVGAEEECPEPAPLAECDLLTANALYNANRAGIRFLFAKTHDVSNDAGAVAAIGNYCDAKVESTQYFARDTINVYYVPIVGKSDMGAYCSPDAPNVIYVATDIRSNTHLAHELGHALGLYEIASGGQSFYFNPDGTSRFTDANLMWQGGPARTSLSLGQVFRMSLESRSMLKRNSLQHQQTRICECRTSGPENPCRDSAQFYAETDNDAVCPRISRGWQ